MSTDCFFPKWSPDGSKIVFNTEDGRIFFINNVNTETPDEPYFVFGGEHPTFGSDGETIIFNSDYEGVLTIYAMSYNESEPIIISNLGYSNQQILSRDGSKIVFSSFMQAGKDIMLIDLDDTTENNVYQISHNDHANLLPDISSDNLMIVWSAFNNNLQGTIMLYSDGKEKPISKGIESANRPKFSPDDSKISFVAIGETKVKFYTMGLDGSNKKSYDIKGGNVANYMWIDNDRILYDAEDGKNYDVGILSVSTGKSELLTGKGSSMHPDILN
jgi:Tol biopolymer transport system component